MNPILTSHDLSIPRTGTLHTNARLREHIETYISQKLDFNTRHAYKRRIWQYTDADADNSKFLIETFDRDWTELLETTDSLEIDT